MAVNPNETLFNEAANKRYLDSFVGGAALGGLVGGVSGIRSQRPESGQIDLTQPPAPQQYGLVTQPRPLQERIDQSLGIGVKTTPKNYVKQFEEAYSEPIQPTARRST
jgi:hypothetical protein